MEISHGIIVEEAKFKQEPTEEMVTIKKEDVENTILNDVQKTYLELMKNEGYIEHVIEKDSIDIDEYKLQNIPYIQDVNNDMDNRSDEYQKYIKNQTDDMDMEKKIDVNEVATQNIFVCSVCNDIYITKEKLIEHKKENTDCHEHKQCEKCEIKSEEGFACIWDLMQHLEAEHKVGHQDDLELFESHETSNNPKKDPHSCSICQKSFYSKYTLRTHQMVHTGERPFQCNICYTFCSTRSKLRIHELTHLEKRPFQCTYCPRSFSFKYKWSQHEKTHTIDQPFKCQGCFKSFSTNEELREHEETPEGKPIRCKFCCKSFTYASKCIEHERLHTGEKPFQCKFCDKTFSLRSTAKNHQRTHTGERPYVCRFCQQTFPFSGSWREHELSHSAKTIPCSFCSKTFSCMDSAKKHETVHLKKSLESNHCCTFCDEFFLKRWDLITHEKTHTHPHVCNTCNKRFSDVESWRNHELSHGERSFTCRLCDVSYRHRSNLNRHMRKHK